MKDYRTVLVAGFLASLLYASCGDSRRKPNRKIVCDKFKLSTKIIGSTLELSVDTDLPDFAVVMVSVSRSYKEKGNSATYSMEYFSEKSTIKKWRKTHKISIAGDKWLSDFKRRQEKFSRAGLGFDVASIGSEINVSMVVPNSNLVGKAVKTKGIVEDEIVFDRPLKSPSSVLGSLPSLDPRKLDVGRTYVVSKMTPMMPSHSPSDPLAALKQMKHIPAGGRFKILFSHSKRGAPWYKVRSFSPSAVEIGTGWINSMALLGQELRSSR